MAYTPAELGVQQMDQRPFGANAAELQDARERAAAASTTGTARPRMSKRNQQLQNGEMNPGVMGTPPPKEEPKPPVSPSAYGKSAPRSLADVYRKDEPGHPRAPRSLAGMDVSVMQNQPPAGA